MMGFCTQLESEESELARLRRFFLIAVLMVHSHVDGNVRCIFTVSMKKLMSEPRGQIQNEALWQTRHRVPSLTEETC